MGCFYFLKERLKHSKKQARSTPIITSSSSVVSNNNRSENDLVALKQVSQSSGSASSHRSIPSLFEERGNLRVFEYREMRNATNDFNRLLKIGEGGFGCVYKGMVKQGKGEPLLVAIKKLSENGMQGHKQWLAEVHFLGVVEHPNLVKLIGYCAVDGERGTQRLLVYEFMPNKSLDDHLFNKALPPLPWKIRLQIALGAAEGLAYLHEGLEVQIIYRDFKASNVLLDKEFQPKLSDFGLAREGPSAGDTHVSTAVMGTYGYAAPDYIETGHLTDKSDVWSFGVVLFEILTGRRSMERNRPRHEQKLIDWVKRFPVESNKFGMIMDPRFENQYSMSAARDIAKLANDCLSKNARERPKMREVVERIKQAMQFEEADGHVELVEDAAAELESEKGDEQDIHSNELTRRRMLHLAKLKESSNVVGKRRLFMLMKVSDQA